MGLSKKLVDLAPVALYTFDQKQTFIDYYEGTGYFTNKIETDIPPLQLKNYGLFYLEYNLPILTPSMSTVETSKLYKSYSSGYSKYYDVNTINAFNEESTYKMTQSTTLCEVDLSEHSDYIKSGNIYSYFFQIKVNTIGSITDSLVPVLIESEYLESKAAFGYFSYFDFTDELNYLKPGPFYFGYDNYVEPLVGETDIFFYSNASFGMYAHCNLEYNIFKTRNRYEPKDPIQFYQPTPGIDAGQQYRLDTSFLRIGNLTLSLSNTGSVLGKDTVGIFYGRYGSLQSNFSEQALATIFVNEVTNIYLEINIEEERIYCYTDKKQNPLSRLLSQDEDLGVLSIGIPCYMYESSIDTSKSDILNEFKDSHSFYNLSIPTYNVAFDNFAIFNKALTQQNRIDLYDLNYNYLQQYMDYGYYQLYDFSELYNRTAKFYVENVSLKNILGGTSYLETHTTKKLSDELSYVERYIDSTYEFALKIKPGSHIGTYRTNYGEQISMIRDTGTVSFSFKTFDNHGLLYANTRYEYNKYNVGLILNSGNIEIWIGNELRTSISGFSNGQWHNVYIVNSEYNTLFYIDEILFYTHNDSTLLKVASTIFGNGLPGVQQLECEYALIGVSNKVLTKNEISSLNKNSVVYKASGQITLNNIAVGTYVYICNHDTGELIEKLITDDNTGNFTYTNRFPYSITIIATDKSLLQGKSYIIDPVEII